MRIVIRPRGSGATTSVIQWWQEAPTYRAIMFHSHEAARAARESMDDTFQESAQLHFLSPTRHRLSLGRDVAIAIDNLDMLLFAILGHENFGPVIVNEEGE